MINSVKDNFELDEFQLEDGDVDLVLLRARRSGAISLIEEEETTTTRTAGAIDKIPNCECLGIPRLATLRTCDMRGPYHGLQFYACKNTVGEGCCNLFLWKVRRERGANEGVMIYFDEMSVNNNFKLTSSLRSSPVVG